jgi:enoyl-CoA hydratase/carnithine racemase
MTELKTASLLIFERPSEGVAVVRLNRPQQRNALNLALRREIAATFSALGDDASVRCIVLTGDERAFCAGADLTEYVDATPADIIARDAARLWNAVGECPKPVIAAVNGYALGGGCEIAMQADIIVAGMSARFGQPEVHVGIIPGGGATQRLPRAVGKFAAMWLMMTGEMIDAGEAHRMGLVSRLVADDAVMPEAMRIATQIAALPALALRQIKELVLDSMSVPLDTGLRNERKAFQLMFTTPEKTARMRSFLDRKAKPHA